ncbi:MAG: ABC transporter permease, partial [Acidimicrobiales bacterium]
TDAPASLPPIRPFTVAMASVRRDWGTARSYRFPLVLTGVQLFVSLASYFFLGRLVGHGVVRSVGSQLHQGFFAFAIVGSTMLSIVATTMLTFARRLRTDQTTGTLEAMLISPSPAWLVLPASASYELVFSSVTSFGTVAIAAAFFGLRFDASTTSAIVAVLAILGSLVLFCAMGIAFSGFVLVFKRGEGVMSLVTAAFSLLGGVLYPIQLLPAALRLVAEVLPFTWVLEVLRAALLDRTSEWLRLGEVWIAGAVLVPLAIWVFHVSLRRARHKGTLAQY